MIDTSFKFTKHPTMESDLKIDGNNKAEVKDPKHSTIRKSAAAGHNIETRSSFKSSDQKANIPHVHVTTKEDIENLNLNPESVILKEQQVKTQSFLDFIFSCIKTLFSYLNIFAYFCRKPSTIEEDNQSDVEQSEVEYAMALPEMLTDSFQAEKPKFPIATSIVNQSIIDYELANFLAETDEDEMRKWLNNNSFLRGVLKMAYLDAKNFNDMSPMVSLHAAYQAKYTIKQNKDAVKNNALAKKKLAAAALQKVEKIRMGYEADVVDANLRLKYFDQTIKRDGRLIKPTSHGIESMSHLIMEQVAVKIGENQSGLTSHQLLSKKVFDSLTLYLKQNHGQLPRALFMPFSDPTHTMLLVVELGADGKYYISVVDSLGKGTGFGKLETIKGAKAALKAYFKLADHQIDTESYKQSPDQHNQNSCGVHVDLNYSSLSKQVALGNSVFSILNGTAPVSKAEVLPARTLKQLTDAFCENKDRVNAYLDAILAKDMPSPLHTKLLVQVNKDYALNMGGAISFTQLKRDINQLLELPVEIDQGDWE